MSWSRCIRHWWYRMWWVRTGSIMACCGGKAREGGKHGKGERGEGEWREWVQRENVIKRLKVKGRKKERRLIAGLEKEKSISQSLFIKWYSATGRWNNQKPNGCTVRGSDGSSQLDGRVRSKPIPICWHTHMLDKHWHPPLPPQLTHIQWRKKVREEHWGRKKKLLRKMTVTADLPNHYRHLIKSERLRDCSKGCCAH